MAQLMKITQVVYIYDKGREELAFTDDSWKWGDGFNLEYGGDYYFETTMPYVEGVPTQYYINFGRAALLLELNERGYDRIWLSNSTRKNTFTP